MDTRSRVKLASGVALAAGGFLISPMTATSSVDGGDAKSIAGLEVVGEAVVPTGATFGGTEIGGLSSITYDEATGLYHAISDDQGNRSTGDPVRYYSVAIDLTDGTFDSTDVEFVHVSQLFENKTTPFAPGGVDPEGFTLAREGQFYMSSEGNPLANPTVDPFIRRYNRNGRVTAELPIPAHYIPNGTGGVRFNLAFESLNPTPDGHRLITAGEGALLQDGPASTFTNGSLARVLEYDVSKRSPVAEYVYEVGPWAEPSSIFGVNGIVEVLPIDDVGTMLVMERSFSVGGVLGGGTGNVVVLKQISTAGATNVLDIDALYDGGSPIDLTPVSQHQVFAFDDLGIPIDNIEGMTFGPTLPDGRQSLVVVSDNNFSLAQFTQFIVLALDIQPAN